MTVVLLDAIRTPRGVAKATGALNPVKPVHLLAGILTAMRDRHGLDTGLVEDAVIGCVTQTGEQGGNIGKTAALVAGWSETVSAVTINRYCASGLSALNWAALQAQANDSLVAAGGVEMMSRVPMLSDNGPLYADPEVSALAGFLPLPLGADIVATRESISRTDCDAYAALSQQRAAAAREQGLFARSVIPVRDRDGKVLLDRDETIRAATTPQSLAALKTVYEDGANGLDAVALRRNPDLSKIDHVHTVGNAPCMADGASLALVASERRAKEIGLRPRARILSGVDGASAGGLSGDIAASRKALARAGLTVADIDLFEVRDSFAAPTIHYMRAMGIDVGKFNVNGSSIALGHPLGATGVMLVATLVDELERRGARRGLAAITGAMGLASAMVVELC